MDLQPFIIPPDKARRAFLEYKAAVAEGGSEEDAIIMRGYREIAAGKRVISLPQVMRAGGLKPNGYPNLAIARADTRTVCVDFNPDWSKDRYDCRFYDRNSRGKMIAATCTRIPLGTFPAAATADGKPFHRDRVKRAMVPSIPPQFRPAYALKNYHILFEVDSWEIVAPVDPALLKALGGGLYAVLAVWDLTDLERAVLGITRAQL